MVPKVSWVSLRASRGWFLGCLMDCPFGCLLDGPQGLTDGPWGISWRCSGVSGMPPGCLVDVLGVSLMSPLTNDGWSSGRLIDVPRFSVLLDKNPLEEPISPKSCQPHSYPLPVLVPWFFLLVPTTLSILGGRGVVPTCSMYSNW